MLRTASVSIALLAAACTTQSPYQDDWGDSDVSSGKADGLADLAQTIDFDETVSGEVDSQSLVLYKIDLQPGDELTAVMDVTDGDLSPHFTLFFGVSRSVSSTTFDVTSTKLTKTYDVTGAGTHVIAVRAFQNSGAGSYDFRLECDGGPCAGDFSDVDLTDSNEDDCLAKAQECAFEDMQAFNGAVGPARARSIFESCLGKLTTDDGQSCIPTCGPDSANPSDAREVCNSIIGSLPFFADQSAACIAELDFCMNECTSLSDGGFPFDDDDELFEEEFSRCWEFGFNGTCPTYAAEHEACGGTLEADSEEQCEELCASTGGAWADDLSSACPGDACF